MNQYELITLFAKYGNRAFKLSAANQLFMLTLLSYWNYETNECYPSNESVYDGCGIDPTNLSKNKKVLVQAGLIKTYLKPMGDKKKHSGYVMNVDFIVAKLKEVAQQVEEQNGIKFNKLGIDPFKREENAPWEEEQQQPEEAPWTQEPLQEAVEEAVAELTADISADEPQQKESNMIELSNGDFARYLESHDIPVMKYFNEFFDNNEVFIPELNATIKKLGAVVLHNYEEEKSPW